jgi:hypothetical protein
MRRQYADGHRVAHPACGPLFSGNDQLEWSAAGKASPTILSMLFMDAVPAAGAI